MSRYLTNELYDIPKERVPGVFHFHVLGSRIGVNTTTARTIWAGTDSYDFPNTAGTLSLVSNSPTDTQQIRVEGLDENFDMIEELVTLNGTTSVTTINSYSRVHQISVRVEPSNDGLITATFNANGSPAAYIRPGEGISQMSIFTIPREHFGLLLKGSASTGFDRDVQVQFFARVRNQDSSYTPFKMYHIVNLYRTNYNYEAAIPQPLPPFTDIDVRVIGFRNDGDAHITNVSEILIQKLNTNY